MSGKFKFYFGTKKENVGFTCSDMADTIEIEVKVENNPYIDYIPPACRPSKKKWS